MLPSIRNDPGAQGHPSSPRASAIRKPAPDTLAAGSSTSSIVNPSIGVSSK
ncbi:MAG: hypothetical protein IRZ16_11490 [Myxococcaceae bacterium]|nr:hypothetical protein [Myxococcaceae bacterium]